MPNNNFLSEFHKRRDAALTRPHYDPLTGRGAGGSRSPFSLPFAGGGVVHIPDAMRQDPAFSAACLSADAFDRLRCRYDFEFWCVRCVKIKDKTSGRIIPFVLNSPQRHVLETFESQRLAALPIRAIILKARQWGGSTLVQMYMAWIQSVLKENWHSLICAHLKDTAKNILGMYTMMLDEYPRELWMGDTDPAFKPFERSNNIRRIMGRGCRVNVSSAEAQEALRGADIAMAHLSETAFWPDTPQKSPADFMRTVCGSIALEPLSLIVMESTANGTGNFFYDEWQRCVAGKGDKTPIFVPWFEIDIYSLPVKDDDEAIALFKSLTPYERNLWQQGLSLDKIKWYHFKAREYASLSQMHAEFPSTPSEAFVNSGANVFAADDIERLRRACCPPVKSGDLDSYGVFIPGHLSQRMKFWEMPRRQCRYMVTVDVGGRSSSADYSVIAVFRLDVMPVVVAQWRGHCDHDLLARRAMALGRMYFDALLVIESNSLETADETTSGAGVLAYIRNHYYNLYCRQAYDRFSETVSDRPGLHTNRNTKAMMIDLLIRAVREGYGERDLEACNELAAYVALPNGSYAAPASKHDDILMTRAFALFALAHDPELSYLYPQPL